MEARGVRVQWASRQLVCSTRRSRKRLSSRNSLGGWQLDGLGGTDQVSWGAHPIVLVTSAITAELWWDGLECGVEDILGGPYRLLACANSWELSRKIID